MRRRRPTSLFSRALGIILMIPSLLHVPLPHVDFHIVSHRHGAGEICPKHDHLLRWHPQANDGGDAAVLHWHWLPPRSPGPADPGNSGRPIPFAHAHDADPADPSQASGPVIARDASEAGSRGALAWGQGLSQALASWLVARPPAPPDLGPALHTSLNGISPDADLARLVRRNC